MLVGLNHKAFEKKIWKKIQESGLADTNTIAFVVFLFFVFFKELLEHFSPVRYHI